MKTYAVIEIDWEGMFEDLENGGAGPSAYTLGRAMRGDHDALAEVAAWLDPWTDLADWPQWYERETR